MSWRSLAPLIACLSLVACNTPSGSGCSDSGETKTCHGSSYAKQSTAEITKVKESGFPMHGHFCGPNIPTLAATAPEAQIAEMERIAPIDLLDDACKRHDICYTRKGYFDRDCDLEMVETAARLDVKDSDIACFRLAVSVQSYFIAANPGAFKGTVYADKIFSHAVGHAATSTLTVAGAAHRVLTTGALIVAAPAIVALSPGNAKDVGQAIEKGFTAESPLDHLPSRFRICKYFTRKDNLPAARAD